MALLTAFFGSCLRQVDQKTLAERSRSQYVCLARDRKASIKADFPKGLWSHFRTKTKAFRHAAKFLGYIQMACKPVVMAFIFCPAVCSFQALAISSP